MVARWIYILVITSVFTGITEVKGNSWFEQANQAYENEDYERAYSLYDSIFNSGLRSAELHYNLGNTAYRLDKYGEAILHFEKALKLNPSMEDAAFNLKIVRSRLIFKQPTEMLNRGFASVLLTRTPDYWAWGAVGMFGLTALFFVLFLFSKTVRMRKLNLNTGIFTLVLGVFAVSLAFWQSRDNTTLAVVTLPSVEVLTEPTEKAKTAFVLDEGATVRVLEMRKGYIEVQFDAEKKGWINETEISKI